MLQTRLLNVVQSEGNGVICGISFGYADEAAQINQTKTPRDSVENTVTMIS